MERGEVSNVEARKSETIGKGRKLKEREGLAKKQLGGHTNLCSLRSLVLSLYPFPYFYYYCFAFYYYYSIICSYLLKGQFRFETRRGKNCQMGD